MTSWHARETFGPARLYHGDCLDIVPRLELDIALTAVVSDPPYGMASNSDSTRFTGAHRVLGDGVADWPNVVDDDKPFDPTPWLAYDECILWGYHHFAARLPVGTVLVWIKKYEQHFGTFLSDAELAWMKGGHGVYAVSIHFRPDMRIAEHDGKRAAHPNQKPIALMQWCIGKTTAPTILDPYMGSGTCGLAAVQCGREYVGMEIQAEYFDTACARMDAWHRQGRLFA